MKRRELIPENGIEFNKLCEFSDIINSPLEHTLPIEFYSRDTVTVARDLLGKLLFKYSEEGWGGGVIVETEAYLEKGDLASHARKKTERSAVMYRRPGLSYVYFIYGMYYCFNITAFDPAVQNAGAVLIRAIEPVAGIELMKARRKNDKLKELTDGPGKICSALDITSKDNGKDLIGSDLIITGSDLCVEFEIVSGSRIGITHAADLPLRFYVKGSPYVSRIRK